MRNIAHVVVVIPAHNEADRLGPLLESLCRARTRLPRAVTSRVVVVADSCVDRTAEVAHRHLDTRRDSVEVVEAESVGRARRLGTEAALDGCGDLRRVWLANTDADTVVPITWLTAQVQLADCGYDAVAGTVALLEDADWSPTVAERFERAYRWPQATRHPHIHGCNLGVRASSYLEVGGWADQRTAEDGDLWRRLTARTRVLSSAENRVFTSARIEGRAPAGFAGHLISLGDHTGSCDLDDGDVLVADRQPATRKLPVDPSLT